MASKPPRPRAKPDQPELDALRRQMAEHREAIRVVMEMYRGLMRETEEARVERLPKKDRPKKVRRRST